MQFPTRRGSFAGHLLLLLRAVKAAGLGTLTNTRGVEGATNDLVANTGEVLHTTTTDEHDGVLLEVVADARNVGSDLNSRGETNASNLTEG